MNNLQEPRVVHASLGQCRSGVKDFVARLPGAQALGGYLSKKLVGSDQQGPNTTKVMSVSFEKLNEQLYLFLGHENGFDIWNFGDGDANTIVQIVSKANDFPVRGLHSYGNWNTTDLVGQKASQGRFATSTFDQSNGIIVQCFSLNGQFVKDTGILRFPSRIYGLDGNNHLLIVSLFDRIYGFNVDSLEEVFSLSCFPNHPRNDGVMALGHRWLAYAADRNYVSVSQIDPSQQREVNVMGAAQAAVGGLFWLGQKSTKVAGDYIQQRQNDANLRNASHHGSGMVEDDHGQAAALEAYEKSISKKMGDAGVVAVLDVVQGRVISHVQAHANEPLTCLAWSPSGSTLATAPTSGQTLHIYGVARPEESSGQFRGVADDDYSQKKSLGSVREVPSPAFILRYKLVRGLTPSSIRQLTISSDNLWCIATTSRTSHIFAIDPRGGLIEGSRHAPALPEQSAKVLAARAQQAAADLNVSQLNQSNMNNKDSCEEDEFDFVNDMKIEEPPCITIRAHAKIWSVGAPNYEKEKLEHGLPPRHPGQSQTTQPPQLDHPLTSSQQDWIGRSTVSCVVIDHHVLLATPDGKCARHLLQPTMQPDSSSAPSSATNSPSASPSNSSPLATLLGLNAGAVSTGGKYKLVVKVGDPDVWDIVPLDDSPPPSDINSPSSDSGPSTNYQRGNSHNPHDSSEEEKGVPSPTISKGGATARDSIMTSTSFPVGANSVASHQAWLGQIERKTRPTARAPLWMSPHVSFSTMLPSDNTRISTTKNNKTLNCLLIEERPSKQVVKRKEVPTSHEGTTPFENELQFNINDDE